MVALCLSLIFVAVVINLPLTAWLIRAGRRWGQMDAPAAVDVEGMSPTGTSHTDHKQHDRPTPVTGGIGITVACLLPVALVLLAACFVDADALPSVLAPASEHLAGLRSHAGMGIAVVVGAVVLHIVGLIDDRRGLGPYLKLFVQIAVAGVLVTGFDLRVLQLLDDDGTLGYTASVAISVLWIVAITNAINFMDNMDGLAGGVSAIIAALYLVATLLGGQWFVAAMCALLLGALLAFLVFNFPPAKVFMGDAGSLVVGFLLAIISIRTTYLTTPGESQGEIDLMLADRWYAIFMPLVILAVPLYDLTSVTLIRIAQGKSPFKGDQQHFSHRLVKKGLSKRTAVLVIWLCTLATGLGGVMLGRLEDWQAAIVVGQTLAVLGVLAMLERTNSNG